MKLFFRKAGLFVLPFVLLIVLYVAIDPYKKIWHYDVYLCDYVMLNRGDISTKVYLNNRDKYKFDSFIFGSSRSTAFTSRQWGQYLSRYNTPYSYGSWNEPIEGIYNKLALVDSLNDNINNALIIFDVDRTFIDSKDFNPLSGDHYLVSKKSFFDYQTNAIINYFKDPALVLSSIDYNLFHVKRPYMKGFIGMEKGDLDPVNNDWDLNSEKRIISDSANYYNKVLYKFYKRSSTQRYAGIQITKKKELFLNRMKAIFDKRHTKYKIVIAPLYDQIKLNPVDLALLNKIFGVNNVYDYSGINSKTNNIYNFAYDVVHFRKKLGNIILKEIYIKNNSN